MSPPSYPATELLTPNGGEVLSPGEKITIEWEATANASTFDILYFPFSGALPDTIAYGLPAETRSFEWTVPNEVTDAARIAVIAFNDVGFGVDESQQTFLIVNRSSSVQITEPNQPRTVKGDDVLRIAWTIGNMVSVTRQQVRLSLDGGKTFSQVLAPNLPANPRNFNWTVPTNIRTSAARVLVVVHTNDGNLFADANEADIVIDNPE